MPVPLSMDHIISATRAAQRRGALLRLTGRRNEQNGYRDSPDLYEIAARSHNMSKYKIVCKAAECPEQADTYVVLYVPTGEVLSQHESTAEARAVVRRHESTDAKRRYLKGLS